MPATPQGFIGDIDDDALDAAVAEQFADDEPSEPQKAPDETAPEPAASSDADDTSAPSADTPAEATAPPAPVEAAHPAAEPAASAPPEPVGTPFQFKASGREQTLQYARQLPDGSVVIPPDARGEFQRLMQSATELQSNFTRTKREFDQKLRAAQTQRTEKDAEADAMTGLIADILRLSPEERFAYLSRMEGNFPAMQVELERRKLAEREKLIAEREKGPQLSPEEQQEQHAELAVQELDAEWSRIAQHPDVKLLSPAEQQQIRDRWAKKVTRLVRPIRDQAEAQQYGGQVGAMIFDPTEFFEDLNFVIGMKKQTAPKPVPTKAAERNAQLNADQQQPKKVAVNPIPPAPKRGAPVGQPRDRKTGQFKTSRDRGFKDYLMSDEDEDDAA